MPSDQRGPIDLGSGHSLRPLHDDGKVFGYVEYHPTPDGGVCRGSVPLDIPEQPMAGHRWKVVQQDPLTLEPSILCRLCGNHGWIREGRWVKA